MHVLQLVWKTVSPLFITLHKARVLKDFFTYSFGSLILRAVSLFLVPFIMRILTPSDYGALALLTAFITIGTAIMGLGLRQILSIEYFHHDASNQKKLINELLAIYTVIAVPTLCFAWLLKKQILAYIFFDSVSSTALLATLSSISLFFYAELLYQILQYNRRAKQLTLLQITVACITMLTTILTVWILQLGVAGVVWAQAFGQLYATVIGLNLYIRKNYSFHRNIPKALKKIIPYIQYGAPFIPGIICSWILASSDRWMLGYYYSVREIGIYSVADLFAQLFNTLVLVPWAGSYLPYILQRYKQHEHVIETIEQENQRIMWISMAVATILISLGFGICKPLLLWILPPSYHESLNYVWLLLMGQVFLLGSYFASALIQYKKKTFFLAFALIMPAFLNLLLNTLLIRPLGILGCSFATCLSYLAYFGLTLRYGKKLHE